MPVWWTKRSLPLSSGVMKPKPLSSLNHLTVPVAMMVLHGVCALRTPRKLLRQTTAGAEHCVVERGAPNLRSRAYSKDRRPPSRRAPAAITSVLGHEDEVLHDDPLVGVRGAGERADRAPGDGLDGGDELLGGRDLEEHPGLAGALLVAHLDHRALGGKQRVVHDAQQRVRAGEVALRLRRAAAELLLVQGHHGVGHVLQEPLARRRARLDIGAGVGHDRPLLSLWEQAAKGWRKMKTRKRRLPCAV